VSARSEAAAQELEPRAYAANPIGVMFAGVAVIYSTGNVVLEPTSPITDVSAKLYIGTLGAGGTFPLFGRTASLGVGLPYAWGKVSGRIAEAARSVERAGIADARVRFAVNLLGGRAMALPEFEPDAERAHWPVFRRQARQHRDEPLGVQAGDRRIASGGSVDVRVVRRRLVLH
jgi:hypothetical protein